MKNNDNIVMNSLQVQENALAEKIKQRRERSFHKSLSRNTGEEQANFLQNHKAGEPIFKTPTEAGYNVYHYKVSEALTDNILNLLDSDKA